MTPKQQYYKNLADTMISHLENEALKPTSYLTDKQHLKPSCPTLPMAILSPAVVPSHLMKLVSIPL